MKTIEIEVPGMQSIHCESRVKNAISQVQGVQVNRVVPGKLTLQIENESAGEEAISAIENAGYEVKKNRHSKR